MSQHFMSHSRLNDLTIYSEFAVINQLAGDGLTFSIRQYSEAGRSDRLEGRDERRNDSSPRFLLKQAVCFVLLMKGLCFSFMMMLTPLPLTILNLNTKVK